MKICPKCGFQVDDDVKICPCCNNMTFDNPENLEATSLEKKHKITKQTIKDLALVVFLPLFFVSCLAMWSFWGDRKKEGGSFLGFVYEGYDIYFFIIAFLLLGFELFYVLIVILAKVKKKLSTVLLVIYLVVLAICIAGTIISLINYIKGIK